MINRTSRVRVAWCGEVMGGEELKIVFYTVMDDCSGFV